MNVSISTDRARICRLPLDGGRIARGWFGLTHPTHREADMADSETKPIGVKELAAHLKTDPRSLRAFLRRTERAVGRGTRYSWTSLADAGAKKIAADWKAAQSAPAPAGAKDDA